MGIGGVVTGAVGASVRAPDGRLARRARVVAVVLAASCSPAFGAPPACTVTAASLVGAWRSSGGASSFETMAFVVEDGRPVFRSWLHDRPEVADGTWSVDDCTVRIVPGDPAATVVFTATMRGRDRLRLRQAPDPVEHYRRIPP